MDADSITISIRTVDESGPALQQVETRIIGVGTAASSTTQLMRGLGTAGSGATSEFSALRTAIEANTAALSSFHGHLPPANQELGHMHSQMRLVSGTAREFGLNLGYSMRAFLAESPAVITAIRAMEGGFIAMGAFEIGEQVIEGVQKLYEKWLDVDAAYEEYAKAVKEHQDDDVVNVHSLETAEARLDSMNSKFRILMDTGREVHAMGLTTFLGSLGAGNVMGMGQSAGEVMLGRNLGQEGVKTGQQGDKLSAETIRQQHELTTAQIEAAHAGDSALGTQQRITAELQKQFDLNNENGKYEQQLDRLQGNQTPRDAGSQKQQALDNAAQAKADAATELDWRKQTEEVVRMQNEAINAGVRGEALHDEERQEAIDAVTRKRQHGEISAQTAMAETEALDMKFHNAKMMRLEDEEYATKKVQEQASQAGLTGIPKIQAETQSRINDLTENPANAGLPDEELKKRTAAYQQMGNQEIVEAQQQFADKIAQITERSNDQMTAGLARVAASEKSSLTELGRAYTEFYGADQAKWQGYQDAKTAIEQAADHQRQKLAEDIDRQIAETEAEAARSLLPPWQAAQQKIIDEYQQRVQKIREDVEQHVVTEEQGAREVQAAWALANSEMERATMQERDRLASQLSSFFDNPAKYMQQRAKQVMFDIMANWMQQLEQNNPRMQGAIGAMFGLNQVGTGSPQHALGQLFGAHSATHDQSGLTNASSTLISAGSTLSASGTMLASSAAALTQAATVWESALYNQSSGGGAGGGSFSGWTGESSSSGAGSDSFWLGGGGSGGGGGIFGGGGASPSFGGAGGAGGGSGTAELSGVLGIPPQLASMIPGGNAIGSTLQLYQGFSKLFSSSGSGGAQLLNPSGGFQPSDINQAPTNSAGVLGTVPDGSSGASDNASAGSSALGEISGIVSGGMTAYSGLSAAWNSSNVGSGLIGAGETALGGAEIGMTVGGPMGAIIGGITGFAAGLTADLIGDHGLSKARHYNTMTVEPALQQLMYEDYDSAMLGMNNLQIQAQKQTAQWGSGAAEYYHSTILPEITNAEAQVTREGRAGRDNVTTSAAQFHGGGWVDDFLDLATSDTEGFIHARQGEYMMHDAAASTNAPWLEAMNRGLDLTSALAPALAPGGAVPRETGAASDYASSGRSASMMGAGGGSGSPVHVNVQALDSKDVNRWLREGGAMQIQTHLNRNTARYSGKALSS